VGWGRCWEQYSGDGLSGSKAGSTLGANLHRLSFLQVLKSGLQGSPVAADLDGHQHEHWLGQIQMSKAVEEALNLSETISLCCSRKLLLG
jgi:hypothetical protein